MLGYTASWLPSPHGQIRGHFRRGKQNTLISYRLQLLIPRNTWFRSDLQLPIWALESHPRQNLWIALIGDVYPYQKVAKRVITPEGYRVVTDEYGNQIAEYDFSEMPPGSEIQVKIDYQVSVSNLEYDLSHCEGELPNFFTSPELHVESNNPQIINLAGRVIKRETVRLRSNSRFLRLYR